MTTSRARWRGALAGLVPAFALTLLFAVSGSAAPAQEVAASLALAGLITMAAGWLAGPLATGEPRRLLVAAIGYAIALISTTAALSLIQTGWDALASSGLDPIAIAGAIAARAAIALAGTAYLTVPAIVLGAAWSLTTRGLTRVVGSAS